MRQVISDAGARGRISRDARALCAFRDVAQGAKGASDIRVRQGPMSFLV